MLTARAVFVLHDHQSRIAVFEVAVLAGIALLLIAGYLAWREHGRKKSDRVLFISELVKIVEDMIPEGKGDDFDAGRWVGRWLDTPQPALGGVPPKEFLGTADGRATVRRLLGSIESGAYA
ncbi:MAG: antitoxin Xre/MbcA/ParS toxin-binding domain-containing protein [Rhodanobacteraceae bacterium]